MIFRDVQQNYPIFILDKQNLTIKQGKVISKGFPYSNYKSSLDNPNAITNPYNSNMVIDFGIEVDGKSAIYTIPENLSVTFTGNLVISPDKSSIVTEIESIKNSAEQILASIDTQKERLDKASKLLSELNPAYRERAETESRLSTLENSVNDIKGMVQELVKSLGNK